MKKIVVVDDQAVLTSIYKAKFSAEGFHVETASDGEEALAVIKRIRPDLVVLDLMLPKINGIEVLKTLRANPAFQATPVIVFSNAAKPGTVEDAWSAGATIVLSKSNTSPKQLVESVQNALAESSVSEKKVDDFESGSDNGSDARLPVTKTGRVLLVENNPESRAIVSHLLTRLGHRIINADGQDHAVLLSEVTQIDLVLTNRTLCKSCFRSFCEQIRRRRPNTPVVMYSMDATVKEAAEALRSGISKFVSTPEEFLNIAEISASLISETQAAL
jgi:CheY-like chemotaxis protein